MMQETEASESVTQKRWKKNLTELVLPIKELVSHRGNPAIPHVKTFARHVKASYLRKKGKVTRKRQYLHQKCADRTMSYSVVSIQETLKLGTIQSIIDFIPVFNLIRKWFRVYLHVPAD
jgi:hypothetical protein